MSVKVIPITREYRDGHDAIHWGTRTSENFFEASKEDIEELKKEMGCRLDYQKMVEENERG